MDSFDVFSLHRVVLGDFFGVNFDIAEGFLEFSVIFSFKRFRSYRARIKVGIGFFVFVGKIGLEGFKGDAFVVFFLGIGFLL